MSRSHPEIGEPVLVESDWYDGPRGGLAEIDGVPSYFVADDYVETSTDAVYLTWPVEAEALKLEREQWAIFVAWCDDFEGGRAALSTHPATGGVNQRFDELEKLLASHRKPPPLAIRRKAAWQWGERDGRRYSTEGVRYTVIWRPAP